MILKNFLFPIPKIIPGHSAPLQWERNELNEFMYASVLSKGEEIIMTLQKSFIGQCLIYTFKKPRMLILSNWSNCEIYPGMEGYPMFYLKELALSRNRNSYLSFEVGGWPHYAGREGRLKGCWSMWKISSLLMFPQWINKQNNQPYRKGGADVLQVCREWKKYKILGRGKMNWQEKWRSSSWLHWSLWSWIQNESNQSGCVFPSSYAGEKWVRNLIRFTFLPVEEGRWRETLQTRRACIWGNDY